MKFVMMIILLLLVPLSCLVFKWDCTEYQLVEKEQRILDNFNRIHGDEYHLSVNDCFPNYDVKCLTERYDTILLDSIWRKLNKASGNSLKMTVQNIHRKDIYTIYEVDEKWGRGKNFMRVDKYEY